MFWRVNFASNVARDHVGVSACALGSYEHSTYAAYSVTAQLHPFLLKRYILRDELPICKSMAHFVIPVMYRLSKSRRSS